MATNLRNRDYHIATLTGATLIVERTAMCSQLLLGVLFYCSNRLVDAFLHP